MKYLVNIKFYQYLSDENVYTNVAIMRDIGEYLLMNNLVNNKIYQYLSDENVYTNVAIMPGIDQ